MSGIAVSQDESAVRYEVSNLESVLHEQGRTQRWLADRVGVSESLISKLLTGKRTISRELGERIGAAIGVPFFVLFKLHERDDSSPPVESQPRQNGHDANR
jgi:transcriptional regulator with XRE-family HTH domain